MNADQSALFQVFDAAGREFFVFGERMRKKFQRGRQAGSWDRTRGEFLTDPKIIETRLFEDARKAPGA